MEGQKSAPPPLTCPLADDLTQAVAPPPLTCPLANDLCNIRLRDLFFEHLDPPRLALQPLLGGRQALLQLDEGAVLELRSAVQVVVTFGSLDLWGGGRQAGGRSRCGAQVKVSAWASAGEGRQAGRQAGRQGLPRPTTTLPLHTLHLHIHLTPPQCTSMPRSHTHHCASHY